MKLQTSGWQKALFAASLVPPLFCAVIWPMSNYSELHTIAVRLPKCGFVVQHGVMVWMIGDFETSLRGMNRSLNAQPSISELLLGKKLIKFKQKPFDDTPPPMQVAGYAMLETQIDQPSVDMGFLKYFGPHTSMGGGVRFLRFDLGQTLPVAAAVPFLLFLAWRARCSAAAKREAQGFCSACGYDIRTASAPRCPECGAEFAVRAVDSVADDSAGPGDLQ